MIEALGRKGLRNEAYCLLLTDQSIFLIRERIRDEVIPGVFGYTSTQTRVHVHPDAEELTGNKDIATIPYERIAGVRIARGFSSTTMRREFKIVIDYKDASERPRRFLAVIVPPQSEAVHGQEPKYDRLSSIRDYAIEAKGLLERSLSERCNITCDFSL